MKKLIHFIMMVAAFIAGGITAVKLREKNSDKEELCLEKRVDKFKAYYEVSTEWIQTLQNGCCIADYFKENGWSRIVIYGKGLLGELLFEELSKCKDVEIVCFVDKQSDGKVQNDGETPIRSIKELREQQYDMIVVTPVFAYTEIKQALLEVEEERKIVSLRDVIVECR